MTGAVIRAEARARSALARARVAAGEVATRVLAGTPAAVSRALVDVCGRVRYCS